jgi:hypothetical protein
LLGTLFAKRTASDVTKALAHTPLAGKSHALGSALQSGQAAAYLKHLPPGQLPLAVHAARASFTSALNEILLVAGIVALVCGVLAFVLIRGKDFVQHRPAG